MDIIRFVNCHEKGRAIGNPHVVIYGPKDFLGRDEEGCHLPYSHLEVHLGELEQSSRRSLSQDTLLDGASCSLPQSRRRSSHNCRGYCVPRLLYLLKNRGIRKPSDLPPGYVPPNLGVPCCRGIEI